MTEVLSRGRDFRSRHARLIAESAIGAVGVAVACGGVFANQHWLDRHFLPSFFLTRPTYVLLETLARIFLAIVGVTLAFVARRGLARFLTETPARALHVTIAAVLALGASELTLRHVLVGPAEWLGRNAEPRRQIDAHLGWTFVPSRTGRITIGGRPIDYVFDAAGYRVRRAEEPVDPSQPTTLFIGESVMFGTGLTWEESIPGQVAAMTGTRVANLAVEGYASDQAYLRLQSDLPRFRKPLAVVAIFMTTLFGRNLDEDRPHLAPGLVWLPGADHGRLRSLAQIIAPYRRDETVERGITVTREVFRAIVRLASARGARPLILVPQFGPEDRVEESLRHRILDDPELSYVFVQMDPSWRVSGDDHPNAHAAHALAEAVAARLEQP